MNSERSPFTAHQALIVGAAALHSHNTARADWRRVIVERDAKRAARFQALRRANRARLLPAVCAALTSGVAFITLAIAGLVMGDPRE